MIKDLKNAIGNVEESRKELDYALDMLADGVGFKNYTSVLEEMELVAKFNRSIAKYVLDMVENQEGLDISLHSLLTVELGLNKSQEDDDDMPF